MDISSKMAAEMPAATYKIGHSGETPEQRAAREFESVFLTNAVEEMLKSVEIGEFGGGHAEETWRGFLARAYADQIAGQGLTGISQQVMGTIQAYQSGLSAGLSEDEK